MGREKRVVIIGGGVAGVSAAESVRDEDPSALITILDEEANFPYYRYLLGDIVLSKKSDGDVLIREKEFYTEKKIRIRKGQKVLSLSPGGKYVYLSNNERLAFDSLLISVGRKEIIPSHLKKYSDFLMLFSNLDDAFKMKGTIPYAKRAILRGKGFNALELARVLMKCDIEVVLVIPEERMKYVPLPDDENEKLRKLVIDAGIILKEGEDINSITKTDIHSFQVEFLSGETMGAEIIFASAGFVPNVGFVSKSGVYMNQGLIIDDYMQTTSESIFAAGDCAEIYHPSISRYWVNLGLPNARVQGRVAGKNMVGDLYTKIELDQMKPYTIFGRELHARWWD